MFKYPVVHFFPYHPNRREPNDSEVEMSRSWHSRHLGELSKMFSKLTSMDRKNTNPFLNLTKNNFIT